MSKVDSEDFYFFRPLAGSCVMLPESPARRRTVLVITWAVRDDLGRSGYLRRTLEALRPSAGGTRAVVADYRSGATSHNLARTSRAPDTVCDHGVGVVQPGTLVVSLCV